MKPSTDDQTGVIHVDYAPGNLGNKMLQYLAAIKLKSFLPTFLLSGIRMEEWQIAIPDIAQVRAHKLRYESKRSAALDFLDVIARVKRQHINRVELNIYSSHVHNLPDVDEARPYFPLLPDVQGYGPDVLLINVRASEILQAVHPEYTVLPVSFYRDLVARKGLRPVFLGQLGGSSRYLDSLRAAFPDATFVDSQGAIHDFSVIAKSSNIVLSVSTFSWLAGWLSHADCIVMPLTGFMNPFQYPQVDLMPRGDARFEYYLFPENRAVIDAEIETAHRALEGKWRLVSFDEIDAQRQVPPAVSPVTWIDRLQHQAHRVVSRLTRKAA